MNCPECGMPYVLGKPHNPRCAAAQQWRMERDRRLDVLLSMFKHEIDIRLGDHPTTTDGVGG